MNARHYYIPPDGGDGLHVGDLGAATKVPGAITGNAVSAIEHSLPPGVAGAPFHRHQHEVEVSYVLEGVLTVQIGDEIIVAQPGSFVVKPPHIFHTFWNAGLAPVRLLEIISPAHFANYFAELSPLLPENAPPNLTGVMALAARYGLEFDMSRMAELEQHGVRLG
ncbi:MAG: cupin domain-containing protein [Aggregatilineales bacterium]